MCRSVPESVETWWFSWGGACKVRHCPDRTTQPGAPRIDTSLIHRYTRGRNPWIHVSTCISDVSTPAARWDSGHDVWTDLDQLPTFRVDARSCVSV